MYKRRSPKEEQNTGEIIPQTHKLGLFIHKMSVLCDQHQLMKL